MTSSSSKSNNTAPEKHVVFISYYFPPMGGGGVQRIVKFLKYLNRKNYLITVLTVKPSYYYSQDPSLLKEIPPDVSVMRSGSLDPFRLWHLIRKFLQKLKIIRSEHNSGAQESAGFFRSLAMNIFVPDSRLLWLPFALSKLLWLHFRQPVDLVVATMPPFTAGLIGALFKQLTGAALVLDYRDAWLSNPYFPTTGRVHRWLSRRMENFCLRRADGVVFVNPKLQQLYQPVLNRMNPRSPVRQIVVRNGFDPADFEGLPPSDIQLNPARFYLGILGSIYSQGNQPLTLLQALNKMREDGNISRENFCLMLVGKWSPDFLQKVDAFQLKDLIEFVPYQPHQKALSLARQFNALCLAIESGYPGSEAVTPGRIYEYLALKKPILALCPPESDLAHLVQNCQAGEVVNYGDVQSIISVLQRWLHNRNNLHQQYAFQGIEEFTRQKQTEKLESFLKQFLKQTTGKY